MIDGKHDECPGTAVEWEQENSGFLTVLKAAFAENDIYQVEEVLERMAPAPDVSAPNVQQREKALGDIMVLELELRDPIIDKISSTTGPAVIKHDGTRMWYFSGLQHNACGPAVIKPNGDVEYYYLGTKCDSAQELDDMVRRAQRHAQKSKTWRDVVQDTGTGG